MRIFGGHDYYDCGLSLGIDPSIVLIRDKSKSVPVKNAGGTLFERTLELKQRRNYQTTYLTSVAVAFCTKVYFGALAERAGVIEGIWQADKLRAWLKADKNDALVRSNKWSDWKDKWTFERYFTPRDVSKPTYDYMLMNKVSILVEQLPKYGWEDEPRFQVNPVGLKQMGFAKAVDPYTAFQELSMWIGGVLGGTSPEIVKIKDDNVLIENHGFDRVTSFRGPRIA